jgi:hypothetical protein
MAGITLCHGWLVDPQDSETYQIVGKTLRSYNKVAERAVSLDSSSPVSSPLLANLSQSADVSTAAAPSTERTSPVNNDSSVHEGIVNFQSMQHIYINLQFHSSCLSVLFKCHRVSIDISRTKFFVRNNSTWISISFIS